MYLSRILFLFSASSVLIALATSPIAIEVILRGKKYTISAHTVQDVQKEIEEQAGLSTSQQAVLYKGKILKATDNLGELGITPGETLNIVPSRRAKSASKKSEAYKPVMEDEEADAERSTESTATGGDTFGVGGIGLADHYREIIQKTLSSPAVEELLSNDEKMEEIRLEMLKNPDMFGNPFSAMGASSEDMIALLNDPEKWRENVRLAREFFITARGQLEEQAKREAAAEKRLPQEKETGVDDIDEDEDD